MEGIHQTENSQWYIRSFFFKCLDFMVPRFLCFRYIRTQKSLRSRLVRFCVCLFQPNDFKKPKELDLQIVTHQVRYLGSVALSKQPRNSWKESACLNKWKALIYGIHAQVCYCAAAQSPCSWTACTACSDLLLSVRQCGFSRLLGDSGRVVNSLDFCPTSLKSLGCFYFQCVLSSQWKVVTVNLQILHCQH